MPTNYFRDSVWLKKTLPPFPRFEIVDDHYEGEGDEPGFDGYAVMDLNTGRIISGRCLHIDRAEGSMEAAYEEAWLIRDQIRDNPDEYPRSC